MKNYESGRSMVEMLGTLAIIGVLSVGGITGYSYGMDKYRANQTVNDVMLMGVDIMTQLSQNRGVPTLTEWGTKTTAGYDFEVVQNPTDATQYGIQIMGVPSRICKIVGDSLQETVAVYVGSDDYNADTETDPCDESNNNTMEFYFAKNTGDGTCTQTCTQCQVCSNGRCVDKTNGEECFNGICQNGICMNNSDEPYSNKSCTTDDECGGECAPCRYGYCGFYQLSDNIPCDNGQGICARRGGWGFCASNKTCETNADCDEFGKDYYCGRVSLSNHNYQDSDPSLCSKLNFIQKNVNGYTVYVSHGVIFKQYGEPYDNPSARNACERMGMNLVNLEVLCNGLNPPSFSFQDYLCNGWYMVCSKENIGS